MNKVQKRTVRKAEMSAQNSYDWGRLVFSRKEFLESSYEEKKEEIIFTYDIEGYRSFEQIKEERSEQIFINLMDCMNLMEVCRNYKVSLKPENIYYDIHNHVAVMFRDVYGKGDIFVEEDFLNQYKALIGFALQDKYSFEDYYDGGMELLKKDKFLEKIAQKDSGEEIRECLLEEYERIVEERKTRKIEIDLGKYRKTKMTLRIVSGLFVLTAVFLGYYLIWERPYQKAVIEAEKNYLRVNYNGVMEAYEDVDVSRFSVYDKYVLANSYIQSESLTEEQKKNIMSALSLDTNEKVLDYWIAMGRLDTAEAENIAQQVSDSDLLLYAYLKEKNMLEADTQIDGEEKSARLEKIENQIEKLSTLEEDEENSADGEEEQKEDRQEDINVLDTEE